MTPSTSQLNSASRTTSSSKYIKSLEPILDSVSLVLLPSLLALVISAAIVGHGEVSSKSILEVLNAMAQGTATIAAP